MDEKTHLPEYIKWMNMPDQTIRNVVSAIKAIGVGFANVPDEEALAYTNVDEVPLVLSLIKGCNSDRSSSCSSCTTSPSNNSGSSVESGCKGKHWSGKRRWFK
jgi:hypothetical protein